MPFPWLRLERGLGPRLENVYVPVMVSGAEEGPGRGREGPEGPEGREGPPPLLMQRLGERPGHLADHPGSGKSMFCRGDVGDLLPNPLLLTALCVLYGKGCQLPRDRFHLHDRMVSVVLHNPYERDSEAADRVRWRLRYIAQGMHTGQGLGEARVVPQAQASHAE
jgi:hypothetical protein